MENVRKLSVGEAIPEALKISVANFVSLFVACVLYVITLWIPYLNVGTTIAMASIPLALNKGTIISPLFIFESKYRKYMGEYFTLQGLMMLSIIPALCFMIIPAIVIAIGWSLALFIMIDKEVSPSEALIMSNKATQGYKWTIFGILFLCTLLVWVASIVLGFIASALPEFLAVILFIVFIAVCMVFPLACMAVIYKKLMQEEVVEPTE
ncbi:MAG: hypothetical protein J6K05_11495 [Bacteroidaceae bacterium]|nr:hypothetical protein [Bacteroidaceae bacterium]